MITKQAVREWLAKKVGQRRQEIQQGIDDVLKNMLDPVLERAVENSPTIHNLAQVAKRFVDMMRAAVEEIPYLKDRVYDVNKGISAAESYGVGLRERMITALRDTAKRYIKEPYKQAYTLESASNFQELRDTVHTLAELLRPEYKKLEDLETLHKELNLVITNETSGKRAYKAILAAGVDMAGFEEEQKRKGNLPMVVNLSADVCILNNNCGQSAQQT